MISLFSIKLLESEIQYLTHSSTRQERPFALTESFTCNVDFNYNDITKKIGILHHFLNVLRNRCTIVESPTAGKALVFSVKDLQSMVKKFSQDILKYCELEFRGREERAVLLILQLQACANAKKDEIENLRFLNNQTTEQLDRMIISQKFQRAISLIYEYHHSKRDLAQTKEKWQQQHDQIKYEVEKDYIVKIQKRDRVIRSLTTADDYYKGEIWHGLKSHMEREKQNLFKSLITDSITKSKVQRYDGVIALQKTQYLIAFYLEKLQIFNKRAKHELQQKIIKMRKRNNTKVMQLQEQLTSNQFLSDQLNKSEAREKVYRGELATTQQQLSAAKKLAEKLQTQIEEMTIQKQKLEQYKDIKGKKLNELEAEVKESKKLDYVDEHLLKNQLISHNKRLVHMKNSDKDHTYHFQHHYRVQERKIKELQRKIQQERKLKEQAFQHLSSYREEVETIERDPESLAGLWKERYEQMLQQFDGVKQQNKELRRVLISNGQQNFVEQVDSRKRDLDTSLPSIYKSKGNSSFILKQQQIIKCLQSQQRKTSIKFRSYNKSSSYQITISSLNRPDKKAQAGLKCKFRPRSKYFPSIQLFTNYGRSTYGNLWVAITHRSTFKTKCQKLIYTVP